MLKRTISNKVFGIFVIFLLIHLILINVNYSEWGDSYRILRASEHIRGLDYPEDEKRLPAYSLLLALRPEGVDQVFWGRFEMLFVSLAIFSVFYKLVRNYTQDPETIQLAMCLLVLNPVLLYWSLRLMADAFFTLLVLITFYLYTKWKPFPSLKGSFLIGLILGVAVLTRFEGYILGVAVGIGLMFGPNLKLKDKFILKLRSIIFVGAGFLTATLPWFLYRNPLSSTYFEEPARRVYDLNTLHIYLVSLLFIFGFTSAAFFMGRYARELIVQFRQETAFMAFILFELCLALVWPAAIPRLFTPIIPFLIIWLAICVSKYFADAPRAKAQDPVILVGLLVVYLLSQYMLKLQFLVLLKPLLLIVLVVQLINISAVLLKKSRLFIISLLISLAVWSFSTIWLHKDIFRTVAEANLYISENLTGKVVYNDVSSVSDWYLNVRNTGDNVTGEYKNMDDKKGRTYEELTKTGADYVLITNEHNTSMEFKGDELDYLEEIKEFRYTIRGKEFFAKILRVKKI